MHNSTGYVLEHGKETNAHRLTGWVYLVTFGKLFLSHPPIPATLSDSERLGENDLYGVTSASAVCETLEGEGL